MNFKINLTFVALLIFTITLLPSCKEVTGCTDPKAENYDPDADIDSGLCTYASEKFIGEYTVKDSCEWGKFGYELSISEDPADTDLVILFNLGGFQTDIKGTITGSQISIDDKNDGVAFVGTGSLNGEEITISYNYTVDNPSVSFDCMAVGTK